MLNKLRNRFRRSKESRSVGASPSHTVINHYSCVARGYGKELVIKLPPQLRFTGETASGAQLREWARKNDITAVFSADPDAQFAQIEASSAISAILWLKRFNQDTGFSYQSELRDCDNFARRARAFPDLFESQTLAQAANFGIYSEMPFPFAGVSDAVHALNVAWTDKGVYVYEPQGLNLTYQRLECWPNKVSISNVLTD